MKIKNWKKYINYYKKKLSKKDLSQWEVIWQINGQDKMKNYKLDITSLKLELLRSKMKLQIIQKCLLMNLL